MLFVESNEMQKTFDNEWRIVHNICNVSGGNTS